MQSVKIRKTALPALTMAAAASAFAIKSASAASLSLYYGDTAGTTSANSDGIYVNFGGEPSTANTAIGGLSGGSTIMIKPNQSTPTTISLAPGGYLSISINALLTGDTNPDGGLAEATPAGTVIEPNNLGVTSLGIRVPVSANDANGSILQPVANGPSYTRFAGTPGYNSYAVVNQSTSEPGGSEAPDYYGRISPGDVEQNSGSVAANTQIFGDDDDLGEGSRADLAEIQTLSASTATYSNSTEFFRNLIYQAGNPGVVTLSPFVDTSATGYWSVASPASNEVKGVYRSPTNYQFTYFGANDTVGRLPVLVIDVVGEQPAHAIVTLGSSAPTPAYGTSSGTLTVTGGNFAQISGLSDVTDYVEASGWNPPAEQEVYGLDVLVNGNQANSAQLATLINAIDGDNTAPNSATSSPGLTASQTNPGGFPSQYDLFLTFASGSSELNSTDYLGIDLSSSNDSNLVGYSFSAVAIVPEPMSVGLLAVGGVGLLARRNRRRAQTLGESAERILGISRGPSMETKGRGSLRRENFREM